jgi:hypothetical protein
MSSCTSLAVEKAGFGGLVEGAKVSYEVVTDRGKESAGESAALKVARRFTPAGCPKPLSGGVPPAL